jgi:serine/threonine-protein kinase
MKCPKCLFENASDSAFCAKCGTRIQAPPAETPIPQTKTIQTPFHELASGTTFAERYQIIEELGKGGMGRVYKVFDTKVQEKIALKLIKPEIASDRENIARFNNELRLARKVRHKNVCGMFDLGEAEGVHFITMEYVHGQNLKSMLQMMGGLTIGAVFHLPPPDDNSG